MKNLTFPAAGLVCGMALGLCAPSVAAETIVLPLVEQYTELTELSTVVTDYYSLPTETFNQPLKIKLNMGGWPPGIKSAVSS